MATYRVYRGYFNNEDFGPDSIDTGLTLEEAREIARDDEGSSRTCTLPINVERTARCGPWFLMYEEE